jgi:hypothetical protein
MSSIRPTPGIAFHRDALVLLTSTTKVEQAKPKAAVDRMAMRDVESVATMAMPAPRMRHEPQQPQMVVMKDAMMCATPELQQSIAPIAPLLKRIEPLQDVARAMPLVDAVRPQRIELVARAMPVRPQFVEPLARAMPLDEIAKRVEPLQAMAAVDLEPDEPVTDSLSLSSACRV